MNKFYFITQQIILLINQSNLRMNLSPKNQILLLSIKKIIKIKLYIFSSLISIFVFYQNIIQITLLQQKSITKRKQINKTLHQMTFRLRPSSRKSTNDNQNSIAEFPKVQQSFISNQKMSFISNDKMSLKQIMTKMEILENSLNMISEGAKREREISSAGYIDMQRRLDTLEYKSFANEKDIQQLSEITRTTLPPLKKQPLSGELMGKNEIIVLKQTLLQQRQSQKQQSKHISQTIQQLSLKQLKLQQQLRQQINRTKSQYEQKINSQSIQMQKIDQFKLRKMDNQYETIKENMQIVQKRIVDQLDTKIKKDALLKQYIHQQISIAKQQLMSQQKSLLSTQTKLTREIKSSLETLYSIINQVKASFAQQLTQTQELTSNNIKRLSVNTDLVDSKYQQKLAQIHNQLQQQSTDMHNFRQWVVNKIQQNRQITIGLEEQAMERINSMPQNNSESYDPQNSKLNQQSFKTFQNELSAWKTSIEQKNLSIFKEISQSLKQMKLDSKKENDQLSAEIMSLTQSYKQLKKSLPNDMKKISQTLVTIFNDEFDVLAEELDLLTEMIKVSKSQSEKFAKDQIKKHKQEITEEIKMLMEASKKQISLGLEKSLIKTEQSCRTSLQKESSYLQSLFNQRFQTLEQMCKEVQSQSKKLNTTVNGQLENFTLSMKQFTQNYKEYLEEQRKQDLKKRIEMQENMRKNATNLMELAYKKSQFLVEGMKKALEMNEMKKDLETKQMIEKTKDQLSKNTQKQKEELLNQMKTLEQKLNEQRQNSQKNLEEQIKQTINNLKKSLTSDIESNKTNTNQKIANLEKQVQNKLSKERQSMKKAQQLIKNTQQSLKKHEQTSKKTQESLKNFEQEIKRTQQSLKKSGEDLQALKKQTLESLQKLKSSQQQQVTKQLAQIEKKIQALTKIVNEQTKQQLAKLNEKQTKMDEQQKKTEEKQSQSVAKELAQIEKKIQGLNKTLNEQTKPQLTKLNEKQTKIDEQQKKVVQKQSQIDKKIVEQKGEQQKQKLKNEGTSQQKLSNLQKKLKEQMAKQLKDSTQKNQGSIKEHDEALSTLRQTVWKLQAMNFSEQAKNKAIFDKINEDLNHVAMNIDAVTKEIKYQQKKKEKI